MDKVQMIFNSTILTFSNFWGVNYHLYYIKIFKKVLFIHRFNIRFFGYYERSTVFISNKHILYSADSD